MLRKESKSDIEQHTAQNQPVHDRRSGGKQQRRYHHEHNVVDSELLRCNQRSRNNAEQQQRGKKAVYNQFFPQEASKLTTRNAKTDQRKERIDQIHPFKFSDTQRKHTHQRYDSKGNKRHNRIQPHGFPVFFPYILFYFLIITTTKHKQRNNLIHTFFLSKLCSITALPVS